MSEKQTFLVTVTMDKPLWKSEVRKMLHSRLHSTQLGCWFGAGTGKWYAAKKITIRPVRDVQQGGG